MLVRTAKQGHACYPLQEPLDSALQLSRRRRRNGSLAAGLRRSLLRGVSLVFTLSPSSAGLEWAARLFAQGA